MHEYIIVSHDYLDFAA